MKRIALVHERAVSTAETGAHCPASGHWFPEGDPSKEQFIPEGHVLPMVDGRPAVWVRRSSRVAQMA